MWALKRKVGDVLSYSDENGQQFKVQIVGTIKDSIFQGYLLVDERRFLEKFPSSPGYSVFLVDAADAAEIESLRNGLERSVTDVGGRVVTTRDILQSFHEIENTYIAIFNVLGTLGVILGSLGLVIVVARSIQERRGEFSVMMAIGIPRSVLRTMVFSEYRGLVLWGLLIGGVASLLSVWPNLDGLPAMPTIILVAALVLGIVFLNLGCGWLVFTRSFRGFRPRLEQAAR
jgi:ABC-type antimicrobial peptide transport system permease subunit